MKVEVNNLSVCNRELYIELPAEQVSKEFDKVYTRVAQKAVVPGFRPGKAPKQIIRNRFKKEVYDEVSQEFLSVLIQNAVKELELEVAHAEFLIKELELSDGQPLKLKAHLEVMPEFELGPYLGISVTKKIMEVNDKAVDKVIRKTLKERAEKILVAKDKEAQIGDNVRFFLTVYMLDEGEDIPSKTAVPVIQELAIEGELGSSEIMPVLNEKLCGMKMDEAQEFSAFFNADNCDIPELFEKKVYCKLDLVEVYKLNIPVLDDSLVKQLASQCETVEDFKQQVHDSLKSTMDLFAMQQVKNDLINQVITNANIEEVPERLAMHQAKERLEHMIKTNPEHLQDLPLDKDGKIDATKLFEKQLENARYEIKYSLVLNKISKKEEIEITKDEFEQEMVRIAENIQSPVSVIKERLMQDKNMMNVIAAQVRSEKVIQFLLDSANISTEVIALPN